MDTGTAGEEPRKRQKNRSLAELTVNSAGTAKCSYRGCGQVATTENGPYRRQASNAIQAAAGSPLRIQS